MLRGKNAQVCMFKIVVMLMFDAFKRHLTGEVCSLGPTLTSLFPEA